MPVRAALLVISLLVLAACTVPGKAYSYLDVRVSGGASLKTPWPTPAQAVRFTVPVHSADDASLGVAYEVRDVTDPLAPVTVATVGASTPSPVTIPAFGDATITVELAPQAAGVHVFRLVLDPADLLNERYEANNAAELTVPVSVLDISIATTTATITRPVPATGDLTLAFSIANLPNPDAAPTGSDVTYTVTLDGTVTVVGTTSTSVPNPVTVGSGVTQAVSLTVPDPGAGHSLTITLGSSVVDAKPANDAVTLAVPGTG